MIRVGKWGEATWESKIIRHRWQACSIDDMKEKGKSRGKASHRTEISLLKIVAVHEMGI